jgi:hypothetical protein
MSSSKSLDLSGFELEKISPAFELEPRFLLLAFENTSTTSAFFAGLFAPEP